MGDSDKANAKRVVRDLSWHAVAAYKPQPPFTVDNCEIVPNPVCGAPYTSQITVTVPGATIQSVDVDYRSVSDSGSWTDLYEGTFTCPSLQSAVTKLIRALITTSQGVSYCEAKYLPVYQPPGCGGGGGGFN
jgi:hypothetical protein